MVAFSAVTAVMLVSSLQSQANLVRIRGQATSSYNGRPLAGVMVSVPEARTFTVTDASGVFRLDGLPAGRLRIRISYNGRETEEYGFNFKAGQLRRIAVLLDVDEGNLDPIVVEAQHPNTWRDLAGFYARLGTYRGFGHFFTREEINRSRSRRISSLLAREGIMTRCALDCLPTRFVRNVPCVVPVSVDGLPFREVDYDLIPIGNVAGVEVYRRTPPSGLSHVTETITPNSVWQGGPYNSGDSCGSVMIWTR